VSDITPGPRADEPRLPWDRQTAIAAVLLVLIALAFWMPTVHRPTWWGEDKWDWDLTLAGVARSSILDHGQFPFWNPYLSGGLPLLANPESAFLSPSFLGVILTSEVVGTKLRILIGLCVGLFGCYLLGRRLAEGPFAPYILAAAFLLSSWYPLYMARGHDEFLALAFLPWVVLFFHLGCERLRYATLAGVFMALMLFEGGVYPAPYTLLMLGILTLWMSAGRRSVKPFRALMVTLCLMTLVGGVKLLPTLDYLMDNPRPWTIPDKLVPLSALFKMFLSRKQVQGDSFPGSFFRWHEYGCYVGWIGLALAAIGILLAFRRSAIWVAAGAAFVALMVGDFGPWAPWRWLHKAPVFSSLHDIPRFRLGAVFCVATLAAIGMGRLWALIMPRLKKVRWRAAATALFLAVAAALIADLFVVNGGIYAKMSIRAPGFVMLSGSADPRTDASTPFIQTKDPGGHDFDLSYSQFLLNQGLVNNYEPMQPRAADVRAVNDADYRGEVWLDGGGKVTTVAWSPNRLEYRVECDTPARLVVNQRYERNWRCTDGRKVEARNGLISVPAGPKDSTVILRYRPRAFWPGVVFTCLGVLVTVGAFVPIVAAARARAATRVSQVAWRIPGAARRIPRAARKALASVCAPNGRVLLFDLAVFLFLLILALRHYNIAVEKYYAFFLNTVEDKAIFNHLLWNLSHHLSWQNTVLYYTDNFLCNHFSPAYLPLSFIYALWPKPEMCWLMLNVGLAGGMYLLYRLAATRLRTRLGAFFMVILFVAHPMMTSNLLIEGWRDTAVAVCFLCLALWAWERKRFALFVLGFVLAAMCKEDLPFIGIGFTALAFIQRRPWRWKIFPACFGILYAILAFWAMRQIGDIWEAQDLSRYAYLGKPGLDALWNMIVHPQVWIEQVTSPAKVSAMRDLFGPLGYLSFLAPEFLVVPSSQFAEVLLADQSYIPQVGYWYVTPTAPFVFYAAVVGISRLMWLAEWAVGRLARLNGRLGRALSPARLAGVIIVAAALALGIVAWKPLVRQAAPLVQWRQWLILNPRDSRRQKLDDLLAAVPPAASVCAQNPYSLMFSSRRYAYCLPTRFDDAEYVVVNRDEGYWPAGKEQYQKFLTKLANRSEYRLMYQQGGTNVYTKRDVKRAFRPAPSEGLLGEFYPFDRTIWRFPNYSGRATTFTRVFRVIDFPPTDTEFVSTDGIRTGFLDCFVATFSGYILIRQPGEYVFTVESDDGFRLWIDGRKVGGYADVRSFGGTDMTVTLKEGAHALRLEYFNNAKPAGLCLYYTPPGGSRTVVPPGILRYENPEGMTRPE